MMSSIEFEESSENLSGTTPERKSQTGNLSSSIGAKQSEDVKLGDIVVKLTEI